LVRSSTPSPHEDFWEIGVGQKIKMAQAVEVLQLNLRRQEKCMNNLIELSKVCAQEANVRKIGEG
jgi:hypothetical protein